MLIRFLRYRNRFQQILDRTPLGQERVGARREGLGLGIRGEPSGTTTQTSGHAFLTRRVASRPSIPPIRASICITSGWLSSTTRSASRPSWASPTTSKSLSQLHRPSQPPPGHVLHRLQSQLSPCPTHYSSRLMSQSSHHPSQFGTAGRLNSGHNKGPILRSALRRRGSVCGPRTLVGLRLSRWAALFVRHEALSDSVDGGLGAVRQVQFAQDVADVGLDCFLADHQLVGDLPVASAPGDQPQNIQLSFGQARGSAFLVSA